LQTPELHAAIEVLMDATARPIANSPIQRYETSALPRTGLLRVFPLMCLQVICRLLMLVAFSNRTAFFLHAVIV
jgi:hypothetical protein